MVATVPCTMRRFHGLQFHGVTVVTPNTWPAFDHGTRRFLLRRFPFSLLYRVELTRLVIVAVAHAHRRPGYWKQRLGQLENSRSSYRRSGFTFSAWI